MALKGVMAAANIETGCPALYQHKITIWSRQTRLEGDRLGELLSDLTDTSRAAAKWEERAHTESWKRGASMAF